MTVLVLAREFDPTADAVVRELCSRGVPVFRTDLCEFPTRLRLRAELGGDGRWSGALSTRHREVRLSDIRSIWHRNPSTFAFPASMTAPEQDFAHREAKLGLGGVLAALDVLWANHPNRCADSIFKPYQWKVAAECGLEVAETMITNCPDSARRFVDRVPSGTITKALGPAGITEQDSPMVAYTRRISVDDFADPSGVSTTATTLQSFVSKHHEVRLTVIGDRWFPIAIHAHADGARVDWRSDPSALTYEFVPIPEAVVTGIAEYMRRMHLVYTAVDFVVTPEDRWVMLEANSGPQFAWLEAATGAPMVAAMAELLMAETA